MPKSLNVMSGASRKAMVGTIAGFATAMVSHFAPDFVARAPWLEEALVLLLSYLAIWLTPDRPRAG